jgi:hypothetical protein
MFETYAAFSVGNTEFDPFPIMTNGRVLFHELAPSMLERYSENEPLFKGLVNEAGDAVHWAYVQIFEDPANIDLRTRATLRIATDLEQKRDIDRLRQHYLRFPQTAVNSPLGQGRLAHNRQSDLHGHLPFPFKRTNGGIRVLFDEMAEEDLVGILRPWWLPRGDQSLRAALCGWAYYTYSIHEYIAGEVLLWLGASRSFTRMERCAFLPPLVIRELHTGQQGYRPARYQYLQDGWEERVSGGPPKLVPIPIPPAHTETSGLPFPLMEDAVRFGSMSYEDLRTLVDPSMRNHGHSEAQRQYHLCLGISSGAASRLQASLYQRVSAAMREGIYYTQASPQLRILTIPDCSKCYPEGQA